MLSIKKKRILLSMGKKVITKKIMRNLKENIKESINHSQMKMENLTDQLMNKKNNTMNISINFLVGDYYSDQYSYHLFWLKLAFEKEEEECIINTDNSCKEIKTYSLDNLKLLIKDIYSILNIPIRFTKI